MKAIKLFIPAAVYVLAAPGVNALTLDEIQSIDRGFTTFNEQTFAGNGRTCATCHIPENQYTISPKNIKQLKGEALELVTLEHTVPGLENPTAVMARALFNTMGGPPGQDDALDCYDRECIGVALRGSMTIGPLALTTQLGPNPPQLGWSANGSPNMQYHHGFIDADADGSIRAFSNGAIAQHFTKTLARLPAKNAVNGDIPDFRLATNEELDSLEDLQMWLGRREEFDIGQMTFSNADAQVGKATYMSNAASCNVCHRNGGARLSRGPNSAPGLLNLSLHSDVNFEAERISDQIGVHIPLDAGITVDLGAGEKGPEAFNIQPVIESVRKQVKFHNNSILASQKGGQVALEGNGKIEGAIQFYFRYPFVGSKIHGALQGLLTNPNDIGGPDGSYDPHLNSEQAFVDMFGENGFNQLGAFLRSLSAWYSLRDCERLIEETIDRATFVAAGNNVRTDLAAMHCGFNLNDTSRVLSEAEVSSLYASVANKAQNLKKRMEKAVTQGNINSLTTIKAEMVQLRTQIATTIELP